MASGHTHVATFTGATVALACARTFWLATPNSPAKNVGSALPCSVSRYTLTVTEKDDRTSGTGRPCMVGHDDGLGLLQKIGSSTHGDAPHTRVCFAIVFVGSVKGVVRIMLSKASDVAAYNA